jgi:hypothetical protein
MDYLKVENEHTLVRDVHTSAILNLDGDALNSAKERKLRLKQEKQEIENLKRDVRDIKNMLNQIVDKLNGA